MKLDSISLVIMQFLGRLMTVAISLLSYEVAFASEIYDPAAFAVETHYPVVQEQFVSHWDDANNLDSLATWHGQSENWVFATSKKKHKIFVFDAITGEEIDRFSQKGKNLGDLNYPNGIAVVDSFLFVVERDNHRVQAFSLPEKKSLTIFGEETLKKPYGITIVKTPNFGQYQVYVTDDYGVETSEDYRINHFEISSLNRNPSHKLINRFGKASGGAAQLVKVESIMAEPASKKLLVADEVEKNIKVFSFRGEFTGMTLGEGLFQGEPEGIAYYPCSDPKEGYWIFTDQNSSSDTNIFHILKGSSFEYLGGFYGKNTSNTDGITLSLSHFGPFSEGALYALNDDGGVNSFSWEEIMKTLHLPRLCEIH